MHALLCVLFFLVACTSSSPKPPSSQPVPPVPPAPKIDGGDVAFTQGMPSVDSMFFTDGGQLVTASFGELTVIDPIARKQLAAASLSSPRASNPRSRPGVGEGLYWEVRESLWAWDEGTILAVARLSAEGDAVTGLSVWRPASGLPVAIPAPPGQLCEPLAISPDRKALVARIDTSNRGCGPYQTGARVFSIATREPLSPPLELGLTRAAAFSRDGRYVAVGGQDSVQIMDLPARELIAKVPLRHGVSALAVHPSGAMIAWTNSEGQLESWSLDDRRLVARGAGAGIAFSPDGRFVVTYREGNIVQLDATTFEPLGAPLQGVHGAFVEAIAFSDDGALLAVATQHQLRIWQLAPSRVEASLEVGWLQQLRPLPLPQPRPFPPFERGGRLAGRVLVSDRPVANAVITLEPHHQEYDDARALPKLTARTKADGSYELEHVPEITWSMLVEAPGATRSGYVLGMREQKAHQVEVRLDPAVTIRAQVVGPKGATAKGVRVFHRATYGTEELDFAADATGRFVIDHLRPGGTYALTARRPDGAVRSKVFDIGKPGPIEVTLRLAAPADPSVVHFLVKDESGQPVAGAEVSVENQAAKTDTSGKTSIDVDTSVTGPKRLRAHTVKRLGAVTALTAEPQLIDIPQAKPVVFVVRSRD